jgi:hypothetical protein
MDKEMEKIWNKDLMCGLIAAEINYVNDMVLLFLPNWHCTNMNGAIRFCKRLYRKVNRIVVIAGNRDDYGYELLDGEWVVIRPATVEKLEG